MRGMSVHISKKIRRALLDMKISRQTINNWTSGRVEPSRLSYALLKSLGARLPARKRRAA